MNLRCTTAIVASLFFGAMTHGADKPAKTPSVPEYPHQVNINNALKHLTAAQEKLERDRPAAIALLQKAQISLEDANNKKGSYRATAIRLTKQAITHISKADTDPDAASKYAHEVAEAIEACHEAGREGARSVKKK